MMNSSITLTEIRQLEKEDSDELWEYYYWIKHLKIKEAREMEEMGHDMKPKGKTMSFPENFVSSLSKKVVDLS